MHGQRQDLLLGLYLRNIHKTTLIALMATMHCGHTALHDDLDECTFNSTGKVINVYTDYGAGKQDITVNFNKCTVNNTVKSLKPVLNINDSNMGNYKYILNITDDNNVTDVDVDKATCSRLFGFGGKADTNNKGKTVVTIDDKTVWKNGKMESHAIDTTYDKYTDGYKDNAFDVTYGEWSAWNYDTRTRTFTKICKYCGYKEEGTESYKDS